MAALQEPTMEDMWRFLLIVICAPVFAFEDGILEKLGHSHYGESFDTPEVLRIKGEVLADLARFAESEDTLLQSLDLARRQAAVGWELRTAISLARHGSKDGRAAEATALLSPVFAKFTEGFESADLKEARRILEKLCRV